MKTNPQTLRVPAIGLGTWQSQYGDCTRAVRVAIEKGYRHIDTAARYQNAAAVGEGIRQTGIDRNALFVTTKVWWTELRAPALKQSLERSLAALRLDYVDLLLIHWPNPKIPLEEALRALADANRQGLTRHIGVSNFPVAWLDRAVALSPVQLSVNQCEYHPYLNRQKLLAVCARHGLTFVAHTPLGSGCPLGDRSIAEIAAQYGKTPAQIVLQTQSRRQAPAGNPSGAGSAQLRDPTPSTRTEVALPCIDPELVAFLKEQVNKEQPATGISQTANVSGDAPTKSLRLAAPATPSAESSRARERSQ